MNKYLLSARLAPTILTSIPICTSYYYLLRPILFSENNGIKWLSPVGDVSIVTGLIFLLVQFNRFLSKEVFQKLFFKDEINMPTTICLMYSNNYFTEQIKNKIRCKIKESFDIELFDENSESTDEINAKKQIVSSVSQIRINLKDNKMLLRHNIEYGFVRNLLGGSLFAFLISVMLFFIFKFYLINHQMVWTSIVLMILYSIPLLMCKWLINRFGFYYAKILFEQFLASKIQN